MQTRVSGASISHLSKGHQWRPQVVFDGREIAPDEYLGFSTVLLMASHSTVRLSLGRIARPESSRAMLHFHPETTEVVSFGVAMAALKRQRLS